MKIFFTGFFLFFLIGVVIGSTSVNVLVQHTSTTKFCISCHEMKSTVYMEYQKTTHYKNASGVSPGCSDCHIPHNWTTTLYRKLLAAKDVYHHFAGTIDNKEKFEERRLIMAERVWDSMESSDSRECRNCHDFQSMDFNKQRKRAATQHKNAIKDSETCIDCHKGIAHKPVHEASEFDEDQELELSF